MNNETGNKYAKDGNVFVCVECGKLSKDKYGQESISNGWDVSCVMNAVEMDSAKIRVDEWGRVVGLEQ